MRTTRRSLVLASAAAGLAMISWPWTSLRDARADAASTGGSSDLQVLASADCRAGFLERVRRLHGQSTLLLDANFNDLAALTHSLRIPSGHSVLGLVTDRDYVMVSEAIRMAGVREVSRAWTFQPDPATGAGTAASLVSFVVTA